MTDTKFNNEFGEIPLTIEERARVLWADLAMTEIGSGEIGKIKQALQAERADMREKAAKVAEHWGKGPTHLKRHEAAKLIAQEIRELE